MPDDTTDDLIARCPEHGHATETWPECRCDAARKAAAWLADNPPPGRTETGPRLRTCDATHTGGTQHPITLGPCTLPRGHDTHQDASGDAWHSPGPADALREHRERAEQAEATIARVRKAMTRTLLQGPDAREVVRLSDLQDALDGTDDSGGELPTALIAVPADYLDDPRIDLGEHIPGYADALATCRRMETRTCPESYSGPCGDRPCARFESDDTTPWENR